jgi:hypothetical protein
MHNGWTSCDSADLNTALSIYDDLCHSHQVTTTYVFFPNCTVLSKHILQRCYRKNMYYQQTINVSLIFITFHYILYSNHITLVMVHISSNDSLYHFTNFTSQKPPKIHRFGASKFSPGWTIILSPRIQRIQGFLAIKMGNITTHDTENDNFDIYWHNIYIYILLYIIILIDIYIDIFWLWVLNIENMTRDLLGYIW